MFAGYGNNCDVRQSCICWICSLPPLLPPRTKLYFDSDAISIKMFLHTYTRTGYSEIYTHAAIPYHLPCTASDTKLSTDTLTHTHTHAAYWNQHKQLNTVKNVVGHTKSKKKAYFESRMPRRLHTHPVLYYFLLFFSPSRFITHNRATRLEATFFIIYKFTN